MPRYVVSGSGGFDRQSLITVQNGQSDVECKIYEFIQEYSNCHQLLPHALQ